MTESTTATAAEIAAEDAIINTPVEMAPPQPTLPRTEKYLRNRPFLMVSIKRRPGRASNINTNQKGWTENPQNWDTFENAVVVDRVNDNHLTNYNVIIDVINGKVVKSQFTNDFDEVVNHYMTKYRSQVKESMDIWLSQLARKVAAETAKEQGINIVQ